MKPRYVKLLACSSISSYTAKALWDLAATVMLYNPVCLFPQTSPHFLISVP